MIRINLLEKQKGFNFFGNPLAEFSDWRQKRKNQKTEKKERKEEKKRKRASLLERRIKNNWDKKTIIWLSIIFSIYGAAMVASVILQILN